MNDRNIYDEYMWGNSRRRSVVIDGRSVSLLLQKAHHENVYHKGFIRVTYSFLAKRDGYSELQDRFGRFYLTPALIDDGLAAYRYAKEAIRAELALFPIEEPNQ